MKLRLLLLTCICLLLTCCKAIPPLVQIDDYRDSKDIVILIDGTSNTPKDNTNINKLRTLLKKRDKLTSFYTVGVGGGPDFAITGMALGVGISKDVQEAYRFICENYSKTTGDKLYIFGFSRGAYTAQILTNLIYTAGIVELDAIQSEKDKKQLIRKIYKAYLGDMTYTERKIMVNSAIDKWEWKHNIMVSRKHDIIVEVLGMFDNVEALAAPDYKEKFCAPNPNHLNQFVNVNKVLHAVALDDNRAQIFTPILASCSNIKLRPDTTLDEIVKEVWFAGAHSDVGGGYSKDPEISYVSLNWMINELKDYNLFNEVPITDRNIDGVIHDSEDNLAGTLFKRRNRDIPLYLYENGVYYSKGKLKIHHSVIKRLEKGLLPFFKYSKKDPTDWFDQDPFCDCFEKEGNKRFFKKEDCTTIEVIEDK